MGRNIKQGKTVQEIITELSQDKTTGIVLCLANVENVIKSEGKEKMEISINVNCTPFELSQGLAMFFLQNPHLASIFADALDMCAGFIQDQANQTNIILPNQGIING